jgi:hypothetical protein
MHSTMDCFCTSCRERGLSIPACADGYVWQRQEYGKTIADYCVQCLRGAVDNSRVMYSRDYDFADCTEFWCMYDIWCWYLDPGHRDQLPTDAKVKELVAIRRAEAGPTALAALCY